MIMKFRKHLWRAVLLGALVPVGTTLAISPSELQKQMADGAKLTIIDIRSTDEFATSHLPGAINVPAAVIAARKLPPLGRVVVYDGGLGNDKLAPALSALRAKPGITAEALEGGLAGWMSLNGDTTAGRGLEQHTPQMITYQQLKTNHVDDIVLVDLRNASSAKGAKNTPRVDLQSEFPQARVTRSPFQARSKSGAAGAAPPLLVLIDKGDGAAETMARALKANGITRYAILAGGEQIIERKGQAGLQREGGSITLPPNVSSIPRN